MKWEMKQLEDAVRAVNGDHVANKLQVHTRSVDLKITMRNYHACESIRILKEAIYDSDVISDNVHEATAASKAIWLSATGHPSAPPLIYARVRAEAEMIAAAQSLHSTADIMASVVYWALDFPSSAKTLDEFQLNLFRVREHLQQDLVYTEITNAINDFFDLPQFKYLTAYVNTTKHRSLVEAPYTAQTDLRDKPRQGFRIKAFKYRKSKRNVQSYNRTWAEDFLLTDAEIVGNGILTIGNSLNDYYARK